ncbi:MAG TPA: hypothetical protein VGK94_00345 [Candidatus Polarisedimenticolia bacterium]|jgi:hypothetical protein
MSKRFPETIACLVVLSLAVTAARGQQTTRESGTCGCTSGPIVDAGGNLDFSHCNAPRVLDALDRYAERSGRLLPERVELVDIEILERKLEQLRRVVVRDLLAWMTWEELNRFLPLLTSLDQPRLGADIRHGHWPGASLFNCDNAVYWINKALDNILAVDEILIKLEIETDMYPNEPALFCNPQLLSNSTFYLNATSLRSQARQWLQFAADSMSQQAPGAAALGAFLGWWRAFQAGFGFSVAFNSTPISGDARCTEVGDAGLAMAAVAQAAHLGYERAQLCAQGF